MKRVWVFLLFLMFVTLSGAQKASVYSFGGVEQFQQKSIIPGNAISQRIYLYNLGNRVVHISLSVENLPRNWNISLTPQLHESTISVNGLPSKMTENLYLEPFESVNRVPESLPEGVGYVELPDGSGFARAKYVDIGVYVPEKERIWRDFELSLLVSAVWVGPNGVDVRQQKRFTFTVKTRPGETAGRTEEITTNISVYGPELPEFGSKTHSLELWSNHQEVKVRTLLADTDVVNLSESLLTDLVLTSALEDGLGVELASDAVYDIAESTALRVPDVAITRVLLPGNTSSTLNLTLEYGGALASGLKNVLLVDSVSPAFYCPNESLGVFSPGAQIIGLNDSRYLFIFPGASFNGSMHVEYSVGCGVDPSLLDGMHAPQVYFNENIVKKKSIIPSPSFTQKDFTIGFTSTFLMIAFLLAVILIVIALFLISG